MIFRRVDFVSLNDPEGFDQEVEGRQAACRFVESRSLTRSSGSGPKDWRGRQVKLRSWGWHSVEGHSAGERSADSDS